MCSPVFSTKLNHIEMNLSNDLLSSSLDESLEELKQMIKYRSLICNFSMIVFHVDHYLLAKENEPEKLKQAMESIEELIQEQVKVHHSIPLSLLYLLIKNDRDSIAEKLIRLGISSIRSKNDYTHATPLHLACQKGKINLVQALIDQGADVNSLDYENRLIRSKYNRMTPLGSCLEGLNSITQNITKPVTREVFEVYIRIINLLINRGADPKKGYIHQSPFFNTCLRYGYEDLALKVIDLVDLNAKEPISERQPLHLAVAGGLHKVVLKLLEKKVVINSFYISSSRQFLTPLHLAVMRRDPVMVETLLQAGADPHLMAKSPLYKKHSLDICQSKPLTAYMMAVVFDDQACVNAILKYYSSSQ